MPVMRVDAKRVDMDKAFITLPKCLVDKRVFRCKRKSREIDVRRAPLDRILGRCNEVIGIAEKSREVFQPNLVMK